MITQEQFVYLITEHEKQQSRLDRLTEAGFSIFDTDVVDFGYLMFEKCLEISFNEDGKELITTWLYEHNNKEEVFYWEADGTEVYAKTTYQLWELVKDCRI